MKFAVLGAGAIGTLVAGLLALKDQDTVLLTRRRETSRKIEKNGVQILYINRMIKAHPSVTTRLDALRDREVVLFAVKSYDTAAIARRIEPYLDESAVLLTIQNGLGNGEAIQAELPGFKLLGGSTTMGATQLDAGRVEWTGQGKTIIGETRKPPNRATKDLAGVLTRVGIPTHVTVNLERVIWSKALINAGINPVTALMKLTNGEFTRNPDAVNLAIHAVREGLEVAAIEGIHFRNDVVKEMLEVARSTADNSSSMLQDLKNHRRTEVDSINGAIVKLGRRHSIPTPVNASLWKSIKLRESKAATEQIEVLAEGAR